MTKEFVQSDPVIITENIFTELEKEDFIEEKDIQDFLQKYTLEITKEELDKMMSIGDKNISKKQLQKYFE